MILLTDKTILPSSFIQERIATLKQSASNALGGRSSVVDIFALEFSHQQYYLPGNPRIALVAIIYLRVDEKGSVRIEGSIAPSSVILQQELQTLAADYESLRQFCRNHEYAWVVFTAPWLLKPVQIPKPWGREVWFTGIEARGQSEVCGDGGNLPLPWMLSLFPQSADPEKSDDVILLKVLDPLPDEVYGDLYLELHEQKQEVYVVTHLDPQAWPEGIGRIQLGFDQTVRHSYDNDDLFKDAYLAAVKDYELVRRALDDVFAQKKRAVAFDTNQPAPPELLKKWIKEISQDTEMEALIEKEKKLRAYMNAFIESYPLSVGDWIKVPRYMPHSLQHGVRVVEFQTPVYERKILSFSQQVLTQSHWDSEIAVRLATLDSYQKEPSQLWNFSGLNCIESIASFDDFEVQRITLKEGQPLDSSRYSLLMVLNGSVSLSMGDASMQITAGQAVLLPVVGDNWWISTNTPSLLLQALPLDGNPK